MKKLFFLLMILDGTLLAQQQGPKGVTYNQPNQFYQKTYTAATANDTSAFLSLGSASDIAVFGSNTDSASILVRYRLRTKNAGGSSGYTVTSAWTTVDTLGQAGDGTLDTSGAQLLGTIALATLLGYDEIQFHTDFLSGSASGDAGDGTTNIARLFYYYKKADAVIAR